MNQIFMYPMNEQLVNYQLDNYP